MITQGFIHQTIARELRIFVHRQQIHSYQSLKIYNTLNHIWRRIKQKIYCGQNMPPNNLLELQAAVTKQDEITHDEVRAETVSLPFWILKYLVRNGGTTSC
jgi:hypothetical protein